MTDSEVHNLAEELNSRSEKLTLSHAVLATRIMLEEKNKFIFKDKKEHIEERKKNAPLKELKNLKEEIDDLQKNEISKVYISLEYLNGGECVGARTFYYKRESPTTEKKYASEHYEILLPKSDKIVERETDGSISSGCDRFAVGHELGHLWLHLDKLKEHINNMMGTKLSTFTNKQIEHEADEFSKKLSELRDIHLKKNTKPYLKG